MSFNGEMAFTLLENACAENPPPKNTLFEKYLPRENTLPPEEITQKSQSSPLQFQWAFPVGRARIIYK